MEQDLLWTANGPEIIDDIPNIQRPFYISCPIDRNIVIDMHNPLVRNYVIPSLMGLSLENNLHHTLSLYPW